MYTHPYSDYVNHILNRSPSKAAYSFTRSSRFPEPKDFTPIQQPFLAANGFEYSDGSRYQESFQQDQPVITNKKFQRGQKRSRSKAPIQLQGRITDHQNSKHRKEDKLQLTRRHLATQTAGPGRSKSKSPARKPSPSKNYTQQLQEIDHSCKSRSISGYYPTGYELFPSGRYILSNVKNVPAHSFGRSEQRYQYVMKSDDQLGPGYYRNFSEFGLPKR